MRFRYIISVMRLVTYEYDAMMITMKHGPRGILHFKGNFRVKLEVESWNSRLQIRKSDHSIVGCSMPTYMYMYYFKKCLLLILL